MDYDYIENLCMNCFEALTEGSVCAKCGFDNDKVQDMTYIPLRTVLSDRYIVGNSISVESDAITYLGWDSESRQVVTIREFFPKGIVNRLEGNCYVHIRERYKKSFTGYKQSFMKLWLAIKDMNSLSAVIPVIDVFEENETAYAVSRRIKTVSLHDFLLRNTDNNILWNKARLMFMPILTTLENLHANGIIHGGITPDNLVLCSDGKVRLAGFCISECNQENTELEFNETPGYTALEQYSNSHKICPATDVYAFSACLYRALVGANPPDARARQMNDKLMIPNRIAEKIPPHVIRALGGGLQIYPEKRIQDIDDFRELLNASPSVVANSAEIPKNESEAKTNSEAAKPPAKDEKKKKLSPNKVLLIIIAVLLVITAGVYAYVFANNSAGGEDTTDNAAAATVTVPDFCTAGYTESDIENIGSWNAQFAISYEYEYSTETEEGIIFKQSLTAGEEVEEGSSIVLTVSKGIETQEVPDVGGLSQEDATKVLEDKGFSVSVVEVYNNGAYQEYSVKSNNGMTPAAGTVAAKGETIIIQVYGEYKEETTAEETTTAESE
ncbi:MAG: PASTA domain-containing protein [Clostridiales bacterium]|nr:PASTA domain-containing protein [Clostridiales bacterium]